MSMAQACIITKQAQVNRFSSSMVQASPQMCGKRFLMLCPVTTEQSHMIDAPTSAVREVHLQWKAMVDNKAKTSLHYFKLLMPFQRISWAGVQGAYTLCTPH